MGADGIDERNKQIRNALARQETTEACLFLSGEQVAQAMLLEELEPLGLEGGHERERFVE